MLFKNTLLFILLICLSQTALSINNPVIVTRYDNQHQAESCAIKNLNVHCMKGENVKLEVSRIENDIYMSIKTAAGALGDHLLLSIDGSHPEMLEMQRTSGDTHTKEALIPRSLLFKLKFAKSISFEIAMNKRPPIFGNLNKYHFDWLNRFGKLCH